MKREVEENPELDIGYCHYGCNILVCVTGLPGFVFMIILRK